MPFNAFNSIARLPKKNGGYSTADKMGCRWLWYF